MSSTRTQIRNEVGYLLDALVTGTATASTVRSITDSSLASDVLSAATYTDHYLYLTGGDLAGQQRRVFSYDPDIGSFRVDREYSAVPGNVAYELHRYDPTAIHRAINSFLRQRFYNTRWPLSLLADPDMEASGVTSWTASNATLTKSTTTYLRGTQALRVANSIANGYAMQALTVTPNDTYLATGVFSIGSGTANIVAYDATNSASIDSVSTTKTGWLEERLTFAIPSTCRSLQVRLQGTEVTADIYWDNVTVRPIKRLQYTMPSWIVNKHQIQDVVALQGGRSVDGAAGGGVYLASEWVPVPLQHLDVDYDVNGTVIIALQAPPQAYALDVVASRAFDALATDAATTTADLDWVARGAVVEFFERLMVPAMAKADRDAYAQALAAARRELGPYDSKYGARTSIRIRAW